MPQLIAIIENDPLSAVFFADALEDAGYHTLVSMTHATIMQLVEHVRPDLFIMNLMRGGVYVGLQTLSTVRDHPSTTAIPVILCSENTTFLHAQRQALAQRKCLILAKPFLYRDLLNVVQAALDLA